MSFLWITTSDGVKSAIRGICSTTITFPKAFSQDKLPQKLVFMISSFRPLFGSCLTVQSLKPNYHQIYRNNIQNSRSSCPLLKKLPALQKILVLAKWWFSPYFILWNDQNLSRAEGYLELKNWSKVLSISSPFSRNDEGWQKNLSRAGRKTCRVLPTNKNGLFSLDWWIAYSYKTIILEIVAVKIWV